MSKKNKVPSIKYKVPVEVQVNSMSCWHSAASMIWAYWQGVTGRQGPMNTLTPEWVVNTGISDYIAFGQKCGLIPIMIRPWHYTNEALEGFLEKFGPLWCAGTWYGVGHVIVLTGIDGDQIFLNDPGDGLRKTQSVSWFGMHLSNMTHGCLLYKDPDAY